VSDGIISKLNQNLDKLIFSTFIGGSLDLLADGIQRLTVNSAGVITIVGTTDASDFPVTPGAFCTSHCGQWDGYIARLAANGDRLICSTFLGGSNPDLIEAIVEDDFYNVTVAGRTGSSDFPTSPFAFSKQYCGGYYDIFVSRMNPSLTKLIWSTYIGGKSTDWARTVALTPDNGVIVAGHTLSKDFPVTPNAWDPAYKSSRCGILFWLDSMGRQLLYSTYFGGTNEDNSEVLALSGNLFATIGGSTSSSDFPTTPGAFQTAKTTSSIYHSGFLIQMALINKGIRRFGEPTPSCLGYPTLYELVEPKAGEASFGFECRHAPPSAAGVLLLGSRALTKAINILGMDLWIDPTVFMIPVGIASDAKGISRIGLPLPGGTQGMNLFAQSIWLNPPGCGGPGSLCASDALAVTVQ